MYSNTLLFQIFQEKSPKRLIENFYESPRDNDLQERGDPQ